MMINSVSQPDFKSKGLFLSDRILEYLVKAPTSTADIRIEFYNRFGILDNNDLRNTLEKIQADGLINIELGGDADYFNRTSVVSLTTLGMDAANSDYYMSKVIELNDFHKILIGLLSDDGNSITVQDIHENDKYEIGWREASSIFYEMANDRKLVKYIELMNDNEWLVLRKAKTELITFLENGGLAPLSEVKHGNLYTQIEIDNKIDQVLEMLNNLGLGQEIIFNEIAELKELYKYLNDKNWQQLLKGKIIESFNGKLTDVVVTTAIKNISKIITGDNLELLG